MNYFFTFYSGAMTLTVMALGRMALSMNDNRNDSVIQCSIILISIMAIRIKLNIMSFTIMALSSMLSAKRHSD